MLYCLMKSESSQARKTYVWEKLNDLSCLAAAMGSLAEHTCEVPVHIKLIMINTEPENALALIEVGWLYL